jgi:tetratricopeptide (TPR) repeat protein
MNIMQRTRFAARHLAVGLAAAAMILSPAYIRAQSPPTAPASGAKIHGTVTDPAGIPVSKGEIRLTTDHSSDVKSMKFAYTVPLDAQGNYSITGIKPGDYIGFVFQGDVTPDYQQFTLKEGDDKVINFDMTREEYMKSLTPERRKEIEDYKKRASSVGDANKVVANLNATLAKVRADLAAAYKNKDDVSADVADMKSATTAKPDEAILQLELGNAEQAQADHLAKADKAAGKVSTTDPDVTALYDNAGASYKKAIDLNAASKKPDAHTQASAANQMGTAFAKEGKLEDSNAAFDRAATLDPTSAGMYYNNAAAVLFNAGQTDAALAAAEKAIAADPTRPDPYFIKGQALITKTTLDPKTQKLVAPPGCAEAYQKYLDLAPDGPQAPTVRDILASLGVKVDTSYRAGKKR